ncbi:MAG TPA: sugar phosphate nucleotidyltransferase [Vicinamibacterales bacterium]|nr:sugar phosphate nucleotidyltransferase [Vicinamibacterales bacterium]
MTLPVAILAGGRATRLAALTRQRPKSLIEVAGRPFIEHQLQLVARAGITRVVLCVGHLGDMIEESIGHGERFGLRISYCYDGDRPLGTGGALRNAIATIGSPFLVMYGDSYLECDYRSIAERFLQSKSRALLTVVKNDDQWDRSNVRLVNGAIAGYRKHADNDSSFSYVDYGLVALHADVFAMYPASEPFDLGDVFQELAAQGELDALEMPTRFFEIGSPNGLAELRARLGGRARQ